MKTREERNKENEEKGRDLFWGLMIMLLVVVVCGAGAFFQRRKSNASAEPNAKAVRSIYPPATDMSVWARIGDSVRPGGYGLEIRQRYGYGGILFMGDYNGVLREVRTQDIHLKNQNRIEPNDPNWNIWLERFESAKTEATTGKRQQL